MSEIRDIPVSWKYKRLGEMFDFIGGGTPNKKEADFWNGNICWASVKDVKGEYLNKTQDYITEKGLKNSASKIAQKGDVILITRISPGKSIIANIRTAINQDLKIARPKFETTSKFIYYFFNSIERKCIKKSSGTTVLGITLNNLNELKIPDLVLAEQQAIVAKIEELLSELDNGKQQLQTALQQLKVYRQSLLKWAFEGKLTHPNVKGGELPDGWKKSTLGKVISISSGNGLTRNNRNDEGNYLVYGGNGITGKHSEYLFENEQLIIGRVGVHCGNAYITKPKSWVTDNAFVVSYDEKEVSKKFLLHLIKVLNLNKYSVSTAQPVISQGKLYPIEVFIPPQEEQQLIVDELESKLTLCDKVEETINQSLQQAEALRQSILKKAFEGKLV
jgi:type I restriction enzyme S subunit